MLVAFAAADLDAVKLEHVGWPRSQCALRSSSVLLGVLSQQCQAAGGVEGRGGGELS